MKKDKVIPIVIFSVVCIVIVSLIMIIGLIIDIIRTKLGICYC